MDGGMIGVVKEGTRDEERQMDHHDNTLECVCVCKHIHLSSHSSPSNMCFADDCIIRAYYCDYEYHSHRPVLAFNEFINLYCRTLSMSLNCLHAKFEHSDRI